MNREMLFRLLFFALLGGVLVMRVIFTIRLRRAGERFMPDTQAIQREGPAVFWLRVALFLLLIVFLALFALNPAWMAVLQVPLPAWLRWIGFALGLASLGLGTWAQMALGSQWSPQLQLRERHRLVTNGPYAWVRHPIYTAMLGYSVSLALLTANWVFIFLIALVVAGLFNRVPKEEQMLVERFGAEYQAYMRLTGRFLPKLGRRRAPSFP